MNLNKDKVFYKIPLGLKFSGNSGDVVGSYKHRRLYAAYLYFKSIDRSGKFTIQQAYGKNRDKANYWIRKLVKAGWATKEHNLYSLKPYQAIWEIMGCEKFRKKRTGLFFYKYAKYDIIPEMGINQALVYLFDLIQKECAERVKRQIRFKLSNGDNRGKVKLEANSQKLEFSVDKAGKLLGYTSPASGSKYRGKYFKVRQRKGRRLGVHPIFGNITSLFFCGEIYV